MGLRHPSPVCYPVCCPVLLLPLLTFNIDISVTSSCPVFPALEQESWWPGPEALFSSLYSSASIYWQGRVKSHISRVQGRPAAGVLPAHEDNKHLMNELPKSVSLQQKNNTSGTALWLKPSCFQWELKCHWKPYRNSHVCLNRCP